MSGNTRPVGVLVVDPDPQQHALLAQILAPRYLLLHAGTLAEATRQLATLPPPHVILVERILPDGDGLSLVQKARTDPSLRDVSIACVTTRAEVRDKIEGFRAGADDYVIKPVDPKTFLQRIMLLTRLRQISS